MNRIIKFRYWNTTTNQMVNNPQMPHKEDWTIEQLFEERGWVWQQFTGLLDKNGKEIYEGDIVKTLMQYTGLKDKNGTEIFCEDITSNNQGTSKEVIREVIFNEKNGTYESVRIKGNSKFPKNMSLFKSYQGNYEVIGNIYSNPELLNK